MHSLVVEKEGCIQDDPGPLKMGDLQHDSFSLVPSLCTCVFECVHAYVCVYVCDSLELRAPITPYKLHGWEPLGIEKELYSVWEDPFSSWAQTCL